MHVVFLDGAYREQGSQLAWQALGHLQTREGEKLDPKAHKEYVLLIYEDESGG